MLAAHLTNLAAVVDANDRISLHDMLAVLGRDSLLLIIIILSILNIIFAPLPVNSFVLGIPLILFSSMYLMNIDIVEVDWRIMRRSYGCIAWRPYMRSAIQYGARVDGWSRPRWPAVFAFQSRIADGLALVVMALVIFLPIPFANIPGSIGMICLALGLLQKDGLLLAAGYGAAVLHLGALIAAKYALLMHI